MMAKVNPLFTKQSQSLWFIALHSWIDISTPRRQNAAEANATSKTAISRGILHLLKQKDDAIGDVFDSTTQEFAVHVPTCCSKHSLLLYENYLIENT
jgi:hypothetical protein